MATVVAMTFVKGPDVEIILFICFRPSSPDKAQLAHASLDSTPDGPLAATYALKDGARRDGIAAPQSTPGPARAPGNFT